MNINKEQLILNQKDINKVLKILIELEQEEYPLNIEFVKKLSKKFYIADNFELFNYTMHETNKIKYNRGQSDNQIAFKLNTKEDYNLTIWILLAENRLNIYNMKNYIPIEFIKTRNKKDILFINILSIRILKNISMMFIDGQCKNEEELIKFLKKIKVAVDFKMNSHNRSSREDKDFVLYELIK